MDRLTKEHRSWNMSRIRGKDTKPETIVRKYLYSQGIRYRLHAKLPGRPDVVMKGRKIVIFINGCFWHAHQRCPDFRWPKSRSDFWREKINGNMERDVRNYASLKKAGWTVLLVWECELKRDRVGRLSRLFNDIVANRADFNRQSDGAV